MRGALQDLRDDVFEDTTKRYNKFYDDIEAESTRDGLRPFMVDIEPLMNYAANRIKKNGPVSCCRSFRQRRRWKYLKKDWVVNVQ